MDNVVKFLALHDMSTIRSLALIIGAFVLIYPTACLVEHGLRTAFWPGDAIAPVQWCINLTSGHLRPIWVAYWEMATGSAEVFPDGGLWYFWPLASLFIFSAFLILFGKPKQLLRDDSDVYGGARFADAPALNRLNNGIELGINPATGRPVRVGVEGTLVSFAPPRRGKSWGLLIPNLAFAEPASWSGPAVVLDTKGEIYRAVADRRRALGRRVLCLDPINLVGGSDGWNPLASIRPDDILYLQRTALALLPEASDRGEASAYFRNRAADLVVGAMVVTLQDDDATPAKVRDYLDDGDRLTAELRRLNRYPAARAALSVMEADPKTRDPIRSTAGQVFQWLADPRLVALASRGSLDLADLSSGEVDLFIAIPPEYRRVLAPFLRWLLSDLFAAIRRKRPVERVLILVDEAAAIGRFEEILTAANELPGYGASLWSFWQNRSQVVSLYGEAGASTLINTAEVVTVSNVSAVDPDESERWSKVVGEYTALVSAKSASPGSKAETTTRTPQAARLLPPSAIATLPQDELIALISNSRHDGRPLRLRKTRAFADPRYRRLVNLAKPIGPIGG